MSPLDDMIFSISLSLYLLREINFVFVFIPLLAFIQLVGHQAVFPFCGTWCHSEIIA